MEQRVTTYVQDARQTLESLEGIDPADRVDVKSEARKSYPLALNALNHADVWLEMAAEQLYDRLKSYNNRMISAVQEA